MKSRLCILYASCHGILKQMQKSEILYFYFYLVCACVGFCKLMPLSLSSENAFIQNRNVWGFFCCCCWIFTKIRRILQESNQLLSPLRQGYIWKENAGGTDTCPLVCPYCRVPVIRVTLHDLITALTLDSLCCLRNPRATKLWFLSPVYNGFKSFVA